MYRSTFVAFTLSLATLSAYAEEQPQGPYVFGYIGAGFVDDAEFSGVQNPAPGAPGVAGAPANVDVDFDTALPLGIGVGYDLPFHYWKFFHPRLEIELSTLEADVSGGSFNGGQQSFGGDLGVDLLLVNNYADIIWQDDQKLVPYVGGGFGVANVDSNIVYGPSDVSAPTFAVQGDDTAFTSTLAAGLTLRTDAAWEVYGEARYFRIQDVSFDRRFVDGGANLLNADVKDDLDAANVTVGLRYRF